MATTTYYGWTTPNDTDLVKNGASAIRTLGSAVDSSLWSAGYSAGKNKIINGDFGINQRAFSSTTTTLTYGFDRWYCQAVDGTTTYSAQTFTLGAAPVAGYEGTNFARLVSTGQTLSSAQSNIRQKIESVKTFAGQTVTVSFWAKASSGTPNIAASLAQYFGSGGSPSATVNTTLTKTAITTSWVRYSASVAVPSISGKTIGTANDDALILILWTSAGSNFDSQTNTLGIQSATIDIWGVQLEAGSNATPFQTATGTKQGELAACQRYYVRFGGTANYEPYGVGIADQTTSTYEYVQFPVEMRIAPTSLEYASIALYDGGAVTPATTAALNQTGKKGTMVRVTGATGLTQYRSYIIISSNTTNGYLAFIAEL